MTMKRKKFAKDEIEKKQTKQSFKKLEKLFTLQTIIKMLD